MLTKPKSRGTTEKRSALWVSKELGTIRRPLLQGAERFTLTEGKFTFTRHPNAIVEGTLVQFLDALKKAA